MNKAPKLVAPSEFWKMTNDDRKEIVNGCGIGGVTRNLIPDHLMGVDIREACAIHDYEYHFAKNDEDYSKADKAFHGNMLHLISQAGLGGLRKWLAQSTAYLYFAVVRGYSKLFK